MDNETLQNVIAGASALCAALALFGPIIWNNLERRRTTPAPVEVDDRIDEEEADRTFKDGNELTKGEIKTLYGGHCPDCDAEGLLEGPSAGLSVNIYCGNEKCGSRFNVMGPFGAQRITDASPKKYIMVEHESPYRN